MINSAQENSTLSVSQALDRVLEILRGSELYSPYLTPQMKDEDPMATEFVGGLMSVRITTEFVGRLMSVRITRNPWM